ncbi:MAG: trypsin-like peptidase domain-containing protein [Puniceicoccales bacterium]|jgi:serine protease Do/serine protease DegQ|nr:trypsin-like peptidase domain-containing protein [Puniceicoccales bacterium]
MKKMPSLLSGYAVLTLLFALPLQLCAEEKTKANVEFPMEIAALDHSNTGRVTSYADTLSKITPAVVSIRTTRERKTFTRDELLQRRRLYPDKMEGLGSGTIIHADGYVLTNNHVVSNKGREKDAFTMGIIVELADGRQFNAKVVGSDPNTDVAILKIEGKKLPVARLADSSTLRIGDVVFAIGNPLGVGMSVTSGIVSALSRQVGILSEQGGAEHFIQTDAAINPGNSGGPLVDTDGRVVGINTAISTPNGGNIGIGFAVPTSLAVDIVTSLVNQGSVSRSYFGIEGEDITLSLAEALKLPSPKGVLINRVEEGGPADKAGLKVEDTLVAVNKIPVEKFSSLLYLAAKLKPSEKVIVEFYRDGKKESLPLVMGGNEWRRLLENNLEVSELTDELRNAHNIPTRTVPRGVVVIRLPQDSPFAEKGIAPGMVIISVNKTVVTTPEELGKTLIPGRTNLILLYVPTLRRFVHISISR